MPPTLRKIVTGGQTGVDRAALDSAMERGVDVGGFVPRGRLDEQGVIPGRYPGLTEAPSADPAVRTTMNVCASDGTVVLSHGPLTGGSELTAHVALALGRPLLHIDLARLARPAAAAAFAAWVEQHQVSVVNVGGPRHTEDPQAYGEALAVLRLALDRLLPPRER